MKSTFDVADDLFFFTAGLIKIKKKKIIKNTITVQAGGNKT